MQEPSLTEFDHIGVSPVVDENVEQHADSQTKRAQGDQRGLRGTVEGFVLVYLSIKNRGGTVLYFAMIAFCQNFSSRQEDRHKGALQVLSAAPLNGVGDLP